MQVMVFQNVTVIRTPQSQFLSFTGPKSENDMFINCRILVRTETSCSPPPATYQKGSMRTLGSEPLLRRAQEPLLGGC